MSGTTQRDGADRMKVYANGSRSQTVAFGQGLSPSQLLLVYDRMDKNQKAEAEESVAEILSKIRVEHPRSVQSIIPFSRLTRYGDYRYDDDDYPLLPSFYYFGMDALKTDPCQAENVGQGAFWMDRSIGEEYRRTQYMPPPCDDVYDLARNPNILYYQTSNYYPPNRPHRYFPGEYNPFGDNFTLSRLLPKNHSLDDVKDHRTLYSFGATGFDPSMLGEMAYYQSLVWHQYLKVWVQKCEDLMNPPNSPDQDAKSGEDKCSDEKVDASEQVREHEEEERKSRCKNATSTCQEGMSENKPHTHGRTQLWTAPRLEASTSSQSNEAKELADSAEKTSSHLKTKLRHNRREKKVRPSFFLSDTNIPRLLEKSCLISATSSSAMDKIPLLPESSQAMYKMNVDATSFVPTWYSTDEDVNSDEVETRRRSKSKVKAERESKEKDSQKMVCRGGQETHKTEQASSREPERSETKWQLPPPPGFQPRPVSYPQRWTDYPPTTCPASANYNLQLQSGTPGPCFRPSPPPEQYGYKPPNPDVHRQQTGYAYHHHHHHQMLPTYPPAQTYLPTPTTTQCPDYYNYNMTYRAQILERQRQQLQYQQILQKQQQEQQRMLQQLFGRPMVSPQSFERATNQGQHRYGTCNTPNVVTPNVLRNPQSIFSVCHNYPISCAGHSKSSVGQCCASRVPTTSAFGYVPATINRTMAGNDNRPIPVFIRPPEDYTAELRRHRGTGAVADNLIQLVGRGTRKTCEHPAVSQTWSSETVTIVQPRDLEEESGSGNVTESESSSTSVSPNRSPTSSMVSNGISSINSSIMSHESEQSLDSSLPSEEDEWSEVKELCNPVNYTWEEGDVNHGPPLILPLNPNRSSMPRSEPPLSRAHSAEDINVVRTTPIATETCATAPSSPRTRLNQEYPPLTPYSTEKESVTMPATSNKLYSEALRDSNIFGKTTRDFSIIRYLENDSAPMGEDSEANNSKKLPYLEKEVVEQYTPSAESISRKYCERDKKAREQYFPSGGDISFSLRCDIHGKEEDAVLPGVQVTPNVITRPEEITADFVKSTSARDKMSSPCSNKPVKVPSTGARVVQYADIVCITSPKSGTPAKLYSEVIQTKRVFTIINEIKCGKCTSTEEQLESFKVHGGPNISVSKVPKVKGYLLQCLRNDTVLLEIEVTILSNIHEESAKVQKKGKKRRVDEDVAATKVKKPALPTELSKIRKMQTLRNDDVLVISRAATFTDSSLGTSTAARFVATLDTSTCWNASAESSAKLCERKIKGKKVIKVKKTTKQCTVDESSGIPNSSDPVDSMEEAVLASSTLNSTLCNSDEERELFRREGFCKGVQTDTSVDDRTRFFTSTPCMSLSSKFLFGTPYRGAAASVESLLNDILPNSVRMLDLDC